MDGLLSDRETAIDYRKRGGLSWPGPLGAELSRCVRRLSRNESWDSPRQALVLPWEHCAVHKGSLCEAAMKIEKISEKIIEDAPRKLDFTEQLTTLQA